MRLTDWTLNRKQTKKNDVVLYTMHLFAGAGGGVLADLLVGHRPIGAVEIDPYCRRVLLSRQLDGQLPLMPVWDDVRTFRLDNPATAGYINRLRDVRDSLCISGGFPCQDISCAGKRAGITGNKSGLWSEFARIVGEVRPRYVFMENAPQLIRRGFDTVAGDLVNLGYSVAWCILSAASVGAPHLRKRFWAVAKRNVSDTDGKHSQKQRDRIAEEAQDVRPAQLRCQVSDADGVSLRRMYRSEEENQVDGRTNGRGETFSLRWELWNAQPGMGGMAHGLASWLDSNRAGTLWQEDEAGIPRIIEKCDNRIKRLKAIGNGQVPLCAAAARTILKTIIDKEISNV